MPVEEQLTFDDPRVFLAFERTCLAADRTLMGWIRTSISMNAFGFTLFNFFQYLHDAGIVKGVPRPTGPSHLGLLLILLGTMLLIMAICEYIFFMKRISVRVHERKAILGPALIGSIIVTFISFFLLYDVFVKLGVFLPTV